MKRFLVIQSAFIGDVVLALPIVQRLAEKYPGCEIHFVLRKGNEGVVQNHPDIHQVWTWNKKDGKLKTLMSLIRSLRKIEFDTVYNIHRFASSGWITARMRAKEKIGFDKNPLHRFYTKKVKHEIPFLYEGKPLHEVQRNLMLVDDQVSEPIRPMMYPSSADIEFVKEFTSQKPFIVIAPASVWFTKQLPVAKWKELLDKIPKAYFVFMVGAPNDKLLVDELNSAHPNAINLCGKLSFLQTAALMKEAERVYVNDSAPMHFASAVNARTTAIFCSTIPEFGFGPLADDAIIMEAEPRPSCKPCGLHGHKKCPEGHFDCALKIQF